jgi:Taurine catabolism dioxygenase TauD, TfdA family/Gamma-butyrobetaine hydroxylase-like, N-terminal
VSRYHHLWLRDNCPQLADTATGHRIVDTATIPADCRPSAVEVADTDALRVTWAGDAHISTYPGGWLLAHDYSNGLRTTRPSLVRWDASAAEEIPRAAYPDVAADPACRREFLTGFVGYGLGLLSDVPCRPGTVVEVGALFGEVRTTSWGKVFDVRSMVDSNSLAYTNLPLVAHTDEAYRDPAPTVQLQHVLRADVSGGASTLVDGFRVAADLRRDDPEAFRLLSTTVLRFWFADASTELVCDAPVIECFPDGEVRAVRFSNHSAAPFLLPCDEMERFYAAYQSFGAMRQQAPYQWQLELGPGDLYMIDNRRVLHGRTGFAAGGARHLQSCYIERDELASRLAVLSRQQPT